MTQHQYSLTLFTHTHACNCWYDFFFVAFGAQIDSHFNSLYLSHSTQVLFQQLYETKPELLESTEAAYTVAMLHELFGQIDFNGDGAVDWYC